MNQKLQEALELIDKKNSEDPHKQFVNGEEIPGEILYSQRMTHWLSELNPSPSDALQIAVRANHIGRWESPRNNYPADRAGYLKWREDLIHHHQHLVMGILEQVGYEIEVIERVVQIMSKKRLKKDAETQMYEDTICLVFLEYYLADFYEAKDVEEEKMIFILRKTWHKMSQTGQDKARSLDITGDARKLIEKALQ